MNAAAAYLANGLSRASSVNALNAAMAAAAAALGADYYKALLRIGPPGCEPSIVVSDGRRTQHRGPAPRTDTALPQIYPSTTVRANIRSAMAANGHGTVSMQMHPRPQQYFALSIEWSEGRMPTRRADLEPILAEIHLYCLHAEQAACRLANLHGRTHRSHALTEEQKVLLSWLAKGMPDHLVAMLMNMTPSQYGMAHSQMLAASGATSAVQAAVLAAANGEI